MTQDAQSAEQLLATFLSSREGRRHLRELGAGAGQPLLLCQWDDPIGEVFARVRKLPPQLIILMIHKGQELLPLAIEPNVSQLAGSPAPVSPRGSIGLLYDATVAAAQGMTFQLSEWDSRTGLRALPAYV